MPQLQLDACGQERGSLQQSDDHRIGTFARQAAQPLRYSWIFLRKLFGMLVEQRQFTIVEFEEFPMHSNAYCLLITNLPLDISKSATNSTGPAIGSQAISAKTTKRTFSVAISTLSS